MKVKICGIKDLATAKMAAACGADFIGFIFYPKSRRYITPVQAAAICQRVQGCHKVGVFVDESPDEVNRIATFCALDFVQLHGHESTSYAHKLHHPIIKAYRWGDGFQAETANAYPAQIILLDSYSKGLAGGTGRAFAWQEAAAKTKLLTKPLLIAGGIDKENAVEAEKIFQPFGVDVSGSLEINGKKSLTKIREFMNAIRRN